MSIINWNSTVYTKNNFMQLAVAWIESESGLAKSIADKQILLFVKERQTNVYHILRCQTTIKFGIETDGTSLEFVYYIHICQLKVTTCLRSQYSEHDADDGGRT